METLIYLFIISSRDPKKINRITAEMIYRMWERNKILREYANPGKEQITLWVREAKQDLIEKGVKIKLN